MTALTSALSSWDGPSTSSEAQRRYIQTARAMAIAGDYLYPRYISLVTSNASASTSSTTNTSSSTGTPRSNHHAKRARLNSALPSSSRPETPEVAAAISLVLREGRSEELYQDFLDAVQDRFDFVIHDFDHMTSRLDGIDLSDPLAEELDEADASLLDTVMVDLLDRLSRWQRAWATPLKALNDPKRISTFTVFFHQLLHSSLPSTFPIHLRHFLTSSLAHLTLPHDEPAETHTHGSSSRLRPKAPSPHFSRLGILPRYSATLNRVAHQEIQKIAQEEASKGWDVRYLAKAHKRVGQGIAGWLNALFEGNEAAQSALRSMFGRMDYSMCKCFFDIRTDELFDIIVDYPESLAALEDLKDCLIKVDQRQVLVDKLNASNRKRLLHPGAETKDVITQYISTIRCLRILDPPGVLLHKVAEPIRKHLRDRPDTIKCIVAILVEGEELQDENELNPSAGIIGQSGEDEAENFGNPKWEPEPVDAAPEFRSGKASDIISTLVSIYESREVIIQELQALLASRLLAIKDYDAVKEIRTIELLKIRFGETALSVCDVMLKDMADSKRIDDHVHGDIQSNVHPLIISRMFWPNIQASALHLTPKLESAAKQYEFAFHHFKPDKHLRWLQHLGTVSLDIELQDRTVSVEATMLQACIVEMFEERESWTIEALAVRLGLLDEDEVGSAGYRDLRAVKDGLAFWRELGVVREGLDGWELVETGE